MSREKTSLMEALSRVSSDPAGDALKRADTKKMRDANGIVCLDDTQNVSAGDKRPQSFAGDFLFPQPRR